MNIDLISLEGVQEANLRIARKSSFKWYEAQPETKKFFGLLVDIPALSAGYCEYGLKYSRYPLDEILADHRYMEVDGDIFYSNTVTLKFRKGSSITYNIHDIKVANELMDMIQCKLDVIKLSWDPKDPSKDSVEV